MLEHLAAVRGKGLEGHKGQRKFVLFCLFLLFQNQFTFIKGLQGCPDRELNPQPFGLQEDGTTN